MPMKEIDRVLTVTEAKNRLLDIVRSLRDRDEIIAITRGGDVAAVVLSPDRYEGLLETIEILSDRRAMESLPSRNTCGSAPCASSIFAITLR
jgi:prevent-host-death family protein